MQCRWSQAQPPRGSSVAGVSTRYRSAHYQPVRSHPSMLLETCHQYKLRAVTCARSIDDAPINGPLTYRTCLQTITLTRREIAARNLPHESWAFASGGSDAARVPKHCFLGPSNTMAIRVAACKLITVEPWLVPAPPTQDKMFPLLYQAILCEMVQVPRTQIISESKKSVVARAQGKPSL